MKLSTFCFLSGLCILLALSLSGCAAIFTIETGQYEQRERTEPKESQKPSEPPKLVNHNKD